MSRSDKRIELFRSGKQNQIDFSDHECWLFWEGRVVAVLSGDVYFSDRDRSRGEMAAINAFCSDTPHVRVMDSDFDYYVASAAMRGLRPLLGKPPESSPTPEGD